MLKLLGKLKAWLVKVLEVTVMSVVGLLVVVVIWQVICRTSSRCINYLSENYGLQGQSGELATGLLKFFDHFLWTEEFATFLLMWVALLGASVAFIRSGHLGMDYFFNKLPKKPKAYVEIFSYVLVAFFAGGVLMFGGVKLISLTLRTGQLSAAMQLKMGYVYMALPISGFFILIFAIETTIEKVSALFGKQMPADDSKLVKSEAE